MLSNRQYGFGLVEVLMSMLLICFSMLGLASLQINGLKSARLAQHQHIALYLAESRLEEIRSYKNDREEDTFLSFRDSTNFFTVTSKINQDSGINGLSLVEVNVSWLGIFGKPRKITLKSAIYRDVDSG